MALDFPNAPTDGQVYTATSGEQWIYETATNSWTSKGLVNTAGGLQYKGDVNITAAPPAGVTSGWQYSVNPGGTANAGFGPGVTGAIAKGSMLMYTGTGWIETSHVVPDATPTAKGIDTRKWDRTGTTLSPATAGDVVTVSGGTAALPGLTPVGDPNTGFYSPGADQLAVSTGGNELLRFTLDRYVRLAAGTGGFQFGGDTAAANALDDYEEGTWTPQLTGFAMSGSNQGKYIKVGRIVTVEAVLEWSSGTSPGTGQVTGLPFANSGGTRSTGAFGWIRATSIIPSAGYTWLTTHIDIGSSIVLITQNGTAGSNGAVTIESSGAVFAFGLTYLSA